jgi:vitamin B12 transporter
MFSLGRSYWLLALVPALAHSQQLKEVFVTANRTATGIESTLADVTTIDSETIARSGVTSVVEVLRDLGGVEISQNGSTGSVSGLFVRGTKTSQTLVLVDGIRLENPMSGGGDLQFLPIGAVDRIEIVRGPASALYGSAAIGGVVQIFTRQQGAGTSASVTAGVGSQGSANLQASGGTAFGPDGSTRVSVSVGAERTDGYEATRTYSPNYQADLDGSSRRNGTASIRQLLPQGWQAGLNVLAASGWSRYDDAYSTPQTARINYRTSSVNGYVGGSPTGGWRTELRVGQSRIDYDFDAFTYAPRTSSQTVSWLNDVRLGPGSLQLGADWLQQRISGDGVTRAGDYAYVQDSRATDSYFAGYELQVDSHQFRVRLRHDHVEGVGSQPTGAIAYGYRLAPTWLVRASWASAFRAPTFDDLYSPFGANPALKPELSRNAEVALEHRAGTRLAKATAFSSRISDAIELDANYVPQNLATAKVDGVTFEARERFGALGFFGQATFQDPRAEQADATGAIVGSQLARRARRFASLGADWDVAGWRLGGRWIAQSERVDTTGETMGGYGIVNLMAERRVAPGWNVFARFVNVGDKRYETAWGYNMPPRGVFVGVRWQAP